jgi:hypothetical protein
MDLVLAFSKVIAYRKELIYVEMLYAPRLTTQIPDMAGYSSRLCWFICFVACVEISSPYHYIQCTPMYNSLSALGIVVSGDPSVG